MSIYQYRYLVCRFMRLVFFKPFSHTSYVIYVCICILFIHVRNYISFKLSAILREVHYLKLMDHDGIPDVALKMSERNEVFRKYITNLNCTIEWYNKIRRNSRDVEFHLIENEIEDIDKLIAQGQNCLNWNSEGLFKYKIKKLI